MALLPTTNLNGGQYVAEQFRNVVEQGLFSYGDSEVNLTLSFGVSTILEQDEEFETCIRRADGGLYKTKMSGRNQVFVKES